MNICVYGASSETIGAVYMEKTEALGRLMAERGHALVFGGGQRGLMGAAARGVHSGGGKIIGVAPSFFNVDGVLFENCTEFIYTDTMRERKQIMEDRADAFIAVPGGLGTYEELFEILTLRQLGRTKKPVALFNVGGYFDPLVSMLEESINRGFMLPACRNLYAVTDDEREILDYLEGYSAPDGMTIEDYKVIR